MTVYMITHEGNEVATRSNKNAAIKLANEQGYDTQVVTGAGHVVHDIPAKRKVKMSAPYTREVDPGDVINNKRVAYVRVRVGFALLDANKTGEGRGTYSIYDLKRGIELGEVEVKTTREAGRWFADDARDLRAKVEAGA